MPAHLTLVDAHVNDLKVQPQRPPAALVPLVSVIVPVYQGEVTIAGAVRSALNQTHPNLEVIVVDDGSTDQTIARLAAIDDPRLRVLRQANAGTAAARNRALAEAGGRYIACLDSDDRWFPEKIAREIALLQRANDPVGVAYSGYYAVDDGGRLLNPAPIRRLSGNLVDAMLDGDDFLIPSACLFERSIFENLGGFRTERFHEDHDFILRVASRYPIYPTGSRLVVYRQSTSGKCRSILGDYDRARTEELSLVVDLASELDNEQLVRLRKNVLRSLYCRFLMYGFAASARRLAAEVDIDSLQGTKKALLARLSAKTGVNFLIMARLAVQARYRLFGQGAWRRRLSESSLDLGYATSDVSVAKRGSAHQAPTKPGRVCIAIPTFGRPDGLRLLLGAIALQQLDQAGEIDVLVIDNDSMPSARAIVENAAENFPFALHYNHVPEPGLSNVRNHALTRAMESYDLLAMVDDDEIPQPRWLSALLSMHRRSGADVVIGPVPKTFAVEPPEWIRRGEFYALPRYRDGERIVDGYSGNCLLDVAALARFGVMFDRALNLAGGEDLFFFRQLRAEGARIVYAADAVAYETIGPQRLRLTYLLKLSFRRGNSLAFCDRRLKPGWRGPVTRTVKGAVRLLLGLTMLGPRLALRGRSGAAVALCDVAQGLGSLAGACGLIYLGYRRGNVRPR